MTTISGQPSSSAFRGLLPYVAVSSAVLALAAVAIGWFGVLEGADSPTISQDSLPNAAAELTDDGPGPSASPSVPGGRYLPTLPVPEATPSSKLEAAPPGIVAPGDDEKTTGFTRFLAALDVSSRPESAAADQSLLMSRLAPTVAASTDAALDNFASAMTSIAENVPSLLQQIEDDQISDDQLQSRAALLAEATSAYQRVLVELEAVSHTPGWPGADSLLASHVPPAELRHLKAFEALLRR